MALLPWIVIGIVRAGEDDTGQHYYVRAIFDNASTLVAGEDVKVAGVKVGKISELHVTPDNKAAIVLDIDKPGFGDFRSDASCRIRPGWTGSTTARRRRTGSSAWRP